MTQESFAGFGEGACFLTVPFVVRSNILSQLTLEEQLKLRETCRTTKDWIDYSSAVQHVPVTRLHDYGAKTFTKFLEKRPPHIIRSVYIENDTDEFLQDPALDCFLELYASSIKSVRAKRFFTCRSPSEFKFYEGFVNLEDLELEKISISSESDVPSVFPATFKSLKKLKIGSVKAIPEPPDDLFAAALIPFRRQASMGMYAWELIKFCERIEYLGYPKTSKYFFQAFVDGRGRGEFGVFCDYIRQRNLHRPSEPNLKYCDFQNEHWSPDSKNALALLKMGNEFGLKYLNMNANQFQYIKIGSLIRMYDLPKDTGGCILSFKNFNCLINETLPAVEKISMSASEVNAMLDYSCVFNGPKVFPNLKEIEIVIDSGLSPECETDIYRRAREFKDVRVLLSHFFYDMEQILVEDDDEGQHERIRKYFGVDKLSIKFPEITHHERSMKARPEDLPLDWIIKGVPNLKKLKLVGWNVKRKETYQKLWNNLPCLEELLLEDCDQLTGNCLDGCSGLRRVTIKKSDFSATDKNDGGLILEESLRERLEDMWGMAPSHFLNHSGSGNSLTWIRL